MPTDLRAGHVTHWMRFGTGPRPALLLHCSLAHCSVWQGLARELAADFQMTAFDLPGHGRSADWDGISDYQSLSTQIAGNFITDPIDVIGHSFGATVALRLAVEQPEKVRSLILIEPVVFAVAGQDVPARLVVAQPYRNALQAALDKGDYLAATRALVEVWGDGTQWEALPETQQHAMAQRIHIVAATEDALYNEASGMLVSGALERLEQPVLLLNGAQSEAVIPIINAGLVARLKRAKNVRIEGASHMLPMTHPALCGAEIKTFLAAV
jgi:pimeloyl-ACP methyl ester carboxylesterase